MSERDCGHWSPLRFSALKLNYPHLCESIIPDASLKSCPFWAGKFEGPPILERVLECCFSTPINCEYCRSDLQGPDSPWSSNQIGIEVQHWAGRHLPVVKVTKLTMRTMIASVGVSYEWHARRFWRPAGSTVHGFYCPVHGYCGFGLEGHPPLAPDNLLPCSLGLTGY